MLRRRLNRIFHSDGRALIVALDHGLTEGAVRGLESPADLLAQLVAGGADAILTSYGMARNFEAEIAPLGLILRLDVGATKLGKMGPGISFYTVEDALRIGADAVAVSAFPGTPEETATLQLLAHTITSAHAWGLPVMAEMQPGGFDAPPERRSLEAVTLSARIAAELGADWTKVPYAEGFEQVVTHTYVPVVILGGARVDATTQLFQSVHGAIKAGASGVAIGRNVFQAADPEAMVAALSAIVHAGADADTAEQIFAGKTRRPRA